LRSAAQFLSYEVSIAITIMPVLLAVETLNFTNIIEFQREQ
jgi:NADH:ubiquinone oxidoreductase subunit H